MALAKDGRLYELLNFDIDGHLDPWIPRNRSYILPKPISHFLGYRNEPHKEPPTIIQWLLTFISTVAGLCLIGGLYAAAPGIAKYHPPAIIASFGASAVLHYNSIRSPLAQPRNTALGHTLSALVGVAVAKGFQLHPSFFANYGWVSGAIGCACASLVMSMTNTIHPPGGATAVLASTEAAVIGLGWMFVPLVLLASSLMLAVAFLFNNLLRQYPLYWWTPEKCGSQLRAARRAKRAKAPQDAGGGARDGGVDGADLEKQKIESDGQRTLRRELSNNVDFVAGGKLVQILPYKIQLPSHMDVTQEEVLLLEHLQERLRTHGEVGG